MNDEVSMFIVFGLIHRDKLMTPIIKVIKHWLISLFCNAYWKLWNSIFWMIKSVLQGPSIHGGITGCHHALIKRGP